MNYELSNYEKLLQLAIYKLLGDSNDDDAREICDKISETEGKRFMIFTMAVSGGATNMPFGLSQMLPTSPLAEYFEHFILTFMNNSKEFYLAIQEYEKNIPQEIVELAHWMLIPRMIKFLADTDAKRAGNKTPAFMVSPPNNLLN